MADLTENVNKPGDISFDELFITLSNGENIDLLPFFVELNIYEDVWSPFLTGDIVLNDSINMIGTGGIAGGEGITIKLRSKTFTDEPQNLIDKTFQVFSIRDRSLSEDRNQIYKLSFMSVEGITDQAVAISKRFKGNTEDIAIEIYNDNIKEYRRPLDQKGPVTDMIIGDTPHVSKVNFLANFWTPVQTLQYLAKYIKGNKHIGADTIFFESNKFFYFTSIQQLITAGKENLFEEYLYTPPGTDIPHRTSGETFTGAQTSKEECTIESMTIPRTIDIIDGQDSGFYSQSVRAYDLYSKERLEAKIDVRDDFGAFVHTDEGIPVPAGVQRNHMAMQTIKVLNSVNNLTQSFNLPGSKGGNSDNENIIAASLYRDNYFNSFKDYTFEIDVPGRTDIEIGRMIRVVYPAPISKTDDLEYDDLFDKQLTGNYLITAIRHKIDTVAHVMKMEIVKNGLPETVGDESADKNKGST